MTPDGAAVYGRALRALTDASVPFLLGGAWAMARHAGVCRYTKDIDLFVRPEDLDRVLMALDEFGFRTEVMNPTWLGKAWYEEHFVDVIFSSGNGIATVDDAWFDHAEEGDALGQRVMFCPVEETIWSKSWIMERERFDGADVNHLMRACGPTMDWQRLIDRFGDHWRVLYAHLVLFGYVYPGERGRIPDWVMQDLTARLDAENRATPTGERLCRGPLLSKQYAHDLHELGYAAPDLNPSPTPLAPHAANRSSRRRG